MRCWGNGQYGQLGQGSTNALGDGTTEMSTLPYIPLTLPFCGDGVVNGSEQCDDGNLLAGDLCSPACIFTPLASFDTTVAMGVYHTCLGAAGQGRCWGGFNTGGYNYGQLGDGSTLGIGNAPNQMTTIGPIPFQPTLGQVVSVAASNSHSCALLSTGRVVCFG